LLDDEALAKLKMVEEIDALESSDGVWTSFRTRLLPEDPHFVDARDAAAAGPDFHKGFHLGSRRIGGERIEGRIIHFDAELVICDNVIFSKHPLSDAEFVMAICDEATSSEGELTLMFARKGSEWFTKLTKN
jgi:hypothetical protein